MRTAERAEGMGIVSRLRRRRDEAGAIAVIVAMFFAFIAVPLSALSIDVARLYVELERVQAAADAAATAGVTYMPDDFTSAKARALDIAADNGFPNSGATSVLVTAGDKPTQLKVTVSSTVQNAFARSFGIPQSTMSRSAVADFNGPAPMGSPCNAFANVPNGTTATSTVVPMGYGPVASGILVPPPAICPVEPDFWGAISGPDVYKDEGSEFEARWCKGTEDNCTSGKNNEFDSRGYIYLVRIGASAVGRPIDLQLYDPQFTGTGLRCADGPSGTAISGANVNDYTPTDSADRYGKTTNSFCAGDDGSNSSSYNGSTEYPTITSFGLRSPVDTLDPYTAPPISTCVKQYPGWLPSSYTRSSLIKGNGAYNDKLARVFHQWTSLCTFTPSKAGDYYLQVRTNVALGGSETNGVYAGNMNVFNQTGDNTAVRGTGKNHFAVRAISSAPAGGVSVAAFERMRIYANATGAETEFNLLRVPPAAATKTLLITFFDVGEGAGSGGTVKIVKPSDSNLPTNIVGCIGAGVKTGSLTNCEVTNITSGSYNGQLQTIRVPIPSTYTCTVTSTGGCWFRVSVKFGSGNSVNDSTTWTAKIVGEPVRLIE